MKKLMTILASAATALFAAGSVSADVINKADFESYAAGVFDSTVADDGEGTADGRFWYCATPGADSGLVVTNYESSGTGVPIADRPDVFREGQGEPNSKFLSLDTTTPLYRRTAAIGTSESAPEEFVGVEVLGDGIYLDTLVKFTAAEAPFAENLDDGDKIAISYVAGADEFDGVTNFVIRAGYIGAEWGQTNYFATVPENFDLAAWHRLTVRTVPNIDNAGHVGFVVYVDQSPLAYTEGAIADEGRFTPTAGIVADLHTARTLYPSAVGSGDDKNTISAAAFSGSGAIDDVVFTTNKPSFIVEAAMVTVTWDTAAVASISIAGTAVTGEDFAAGTKTLELVGTTIAVDAVPNSGYDLVFTPPETETGAWDSNEKKFTGLAANDVCAVTGFRPLFDVGGTHYGSLEAAIEAAEAGTALAPATLKLLANCNEMIKLTAGTVILDLAGHDIQGTDEQAFSVVCQGAHMIVTNSAPATGAVKRPVENEDAAGAMQVKGDDGTVAVYGAKFDDVISLKPDSVEKTAIFAIYSGTFIDTDAGNDPTAFAYNAYVQNSAPVTSLGSNYFQVGAAPVIPTTFALTITVADNTSASYKIGDGEATAYTEAVQVEEGSAVVITATPAPNYTYTGVVLGDGWELVEGNAVYSIASMAEATTVVVPAPEVATIGTYQITVITTNNASYAAAYTEGGAAITPDNDVLTVTVGQSVTITVTPAENYEYATQPDGWTLSNGVITKTVAEAGTVEIPGPTAKQQGGYPTYIGDDTAKQAKYDAWAETYGADADSQYEEAFLLNCAPDNVATEKAAFKLNITVDGTTVTVTTPEGKSYNGTVQLKGSNDLSTWTNVDSASTSYNFYKAELK